MNKDIYQCKSSPPRLSNKATIVLATFTPIAIFKNAIKPPLNNLPGSPAEKIGKLLRNGCP